MPELPEVETTTRGLRKELVGLKITDVWTDLKTKDKRQKDAVANPTYFKIFKKEVLNKKILSAERKAKNILINLSGNKTILIHMKMTGHLLYGKYKFLKKENKWIPDEEGPLKDPYNRFVHTIFSLSNKKFLAFSDSRKFGKITLLDTKTAHETRHLKDIGPDPLSKNFDFKKLKERLNKKPNGKIKTVLIDQSIIAGIGNIYSDEILWYAGIHPERKVSKINELEFKKMFKAIKETLKKGINFGGDSMSDYRNIYGLPGKFQLHHEAYRRTGERCRKKGCKGVIIRKIINNRSAHFCSIHQK
ncbi:MAG: DNA-formamidopyrimidine glycosylase [Minisyncoccia bacterium]